MDFKLNFEHKKSYHYINHEKQVLFLGSCFSDEISSKFSYHGFKTLANPFGTIFNPILLSKFIDNCIDTNQTSERIFQRKDIFLSWDASSLIYDFDINDFNKKLSEIRCNFLDWLKSSHTIFITFGSAWGYILNDTTDNTGLVANCHKMPSNHFRKELSPIDLIVTRWDNTIEQIRQVNPTIQIIFTVSPVRHIKDGLIENNQSKSILIESIRQINENVNSNYFPSYEIMIDELRDYRFFKSDLIHPSDEAVEYIWSKIKYGFFDIKTNSLVNEINTLKKQISHKYLHSESKETIETRMKLEAKLVEFKNSNPEIIL